MNCGAIAPLCDGIVPTDACCPKCGKIDGQPKIECVFQLLHTLCSLYRRTTNCPDTPAGPQPNCWNNYRWHDLSCSGFKKAKALYCSGKELGGGGGGGEFVLWAGLDIV